VPLIREFTILCDDIRVENTGKFILIGVYTPHIVIPTLPFGFSTLCFFTGFTSDAPARYQIRAQLRHLETGHVVGELIGMMQHAAPGLGTGVIKFPNVIFNQGGRYNFILTIEQHPEPFVYDFDVILQAAQLPPAQPAR